MNIKLTDTQLTSLIQAVDYLINEQKKLWKQHHDHKKELTFIQNTLQLSLTKKSFKIELTDYETKALIDCLEFLLYNPSGFPNKQKVHNDLETILYKMLKSPRFNLILNQYQIYNEKTDTFDTIESDNA